MNVFTAGYVSEVYMIFLAQNCYFFIFARNMGDYLYLKLEPIKLCIGH